ncbi:MAG TPA: CHASE domain-containing protein [Candidatus Polarisedimenticolaceae bacterium]|nr:CHASE domain-containing protein [Candidatus Polarisedimenticolaceae bacterium]
MLKILNHLSRSNRTLSKAILIPVIIILAACFAGNFYVWKSLERVNTETARARFNATIDTRIWILKNQLESYVSTLYSSRAALEMSANPSRQTWTNFIESQGLSRRYPAIVAVAYVRQVEGATEQRSLMNEINSQKNPGENEFRVYPDSSRSRKEIVAFVAPSKVSQGLIGYDLASDPVRDSALMKAAEQDTPTATEPLKLLPDNVKGILLALPVNRTNHTDTNRGDAADVRGFAAMSIDLNILLRDVFKQKPTAGQLSVALSSPVSAEADQTVFFKNDFSFNPKAGVQERTVILDVANQEWQVKFKAPKNYGLSATAKTLPILAVLSTNALLFMITIIIYLGVRQRQTLRTPSNPSNQE